MSNLELNLELTDEQKLKISENRQRAMRLKQARAHVSYPKDRPERSTNGITNLQRDDVKENNVLNTSSTRKKRENVSRPIDTQAGFLLPTEANDELPTYTVFESDPVPGQAYHICLECGKEFLNSFLWSAFDVPVCDPCKRTDRETDDKYGLVTKTTAKEDYLLNDDDLSGKHGNLRFLERPNPSGKSYNPMKLYLRLQVEKTSFTRWGSEEGLDDEIDRREAEKRRQKQLRYEKKVR
eukprot:Ihof_evm1s151 gene=Ihof_evmTU1s151